MDKPAVQKHRLVILEMVRELGLGGTERAMQEFAISLKKLGHEVIVGAYHTQGPRRSILEAAGIPVVAWDDAQTDSLLARYRVDVVHCHSVPSEPFRGKALTVQEVVFAPSFTPQSDLNLIISMSLAAKINRYRPLAYGKDFYVLYYPQNIDAWLKHTCSSKEVAAIRKRMGFGLEHIVLGRMGRSEVSKTDYLLLDATPRIAKAVPEARFVFMGLPYLYRLALRLRPSLRGKIVFLPESPDDRAIARFFQSIDVFWHTASLGETFGNVNAEAMIWRKPVITHSTPFKGKPGERIDNAQTEVVEHMKTGIVADYPQDVVAAVRYLQQDRSRIAALGQRGFAKVKQSFASKIIAQQFVDIVTAKMERRDALVQPSKKTVQRFFSKGYSERAVASMDVTSSREKLAYQVRKKIYKIVELCYLVVRLILRRLAGMDLETYGYGNKDPLAN